MLHIIFWYGWELDINLFSDTGKDTNLDSKKNFSFKISMNLPDPNTDTEVC